MLDKFSLSSFLLLEFTADWLREAGRNALVLEDEGKLFTTGGVMEDISAGEVRLEVDD